MKSGVSSLWQHAAGQRFGLLHYCDREIQSFASPADLQHGGRDSSTVRWLARPPDRTHWRQSQQQMRVPQYEIVAGGCTAPAAAQMACWQPSAPEVAALSAAETDLHASQHIVERRFVRPGQLCNRQTYTAFHNSGSSPLKLPDAILSLHACSRLVRDASPDGLSTERCWEHPDSLQALDHCTLPPTSGQAVVEAVRLRSQLSKLFRTMRSLNTKKGAALQQRQL